MQYTILSVGTYTKKILPKFTMKQKMYIYALKCTFNPDPIWDQKWNYMNLSEIV